MQGRNRKGIGSRWSMHTQTDELWSEPVLIISAKGWEDTRQECFHGGGNFWQQHTLLDLRLNKQLAGGAQELSNTFDCDWLKAMYLTLHFGLWPSKTRHTHTDTNIHVTETKVNRGICSLLIWDSGLYFLFYSISVSFLNKIWWKQTRWMWASIWKLCEETFWESQWVCLALFIRPRKWSFVFLGGKGLGWGWDNQRFPCTAFLCAIQFQKHQEIQTFPHHVPDTWNSSWIPFTASVDAYQVSGTCQAYLCFFKKELRVIIFSFLFFDDFRFSNKTFYLKRKLF